jgi:hypothetical protein
MDSALMLSDGDHFKNIQNLEVELEAFKATRT